MIQKIRLNLNLTSESNAFDIQKQLTDFIRNRLSAEIDRIINRLNIPENQVVFVPKIELDLGKLSSVDYIHQFQKAFLIEFECQFSKFVQQVKAKDSRTFEQTSILKEESVLIQDAELSAIIFFLRKSYFPWWFKLNLRVEDLFLSLLNEKTSALRDSILNQIPKERKIIIDRILTILSSSNIEKFYFKLYLSGKEKTTKVVKELKSKLTEIQFTRLVQESLIYIADKKPEDNVLVDSIYFVLKNNLLNISQVEFDKLEIKELSTFKLLETPVVSQKKEFENSLQTTDFYQNSQTILSESKEEKRYKLDERLENQMKKTRAMTKQLSLELFSFDFISSLFFYYLATSQFYSWSYDLINSIKKQHFFKNENQLVEHLFNYLSTHYVQEFRQKFSDFIALREIQFFLISKLPPTLVLKFLSYYFNENKTVFLQLNLKLTQEYSKNKLSIDYTRIFKLFFDNLEEISKLKEEELESFHSELWSQSPLEIYENELTSAKKYFTSLILTGEILAGSEQFSQERLILLIEQIEIEFFTDFLSLANRYYIFIELFSEKIVIQLLKKYFGVRFEFLNQIWQELFLILDTMEYRKITNSNLSKLFYAISFEIIFEQISGKSNQIQKFYASLKNFFSQKQPQLNFEQQFVTAISRISKQRIVLFSDFKAESFFIFISTHFDESRIKNEIARIVWQLVSYIKTGSLHFPSLYRNLAELVDYFQQYRTQILAEFSEILIQNLKSEISLQRLFALFGKTSAQALLIELYENTLDLEQKMSEHEKNRSLLEKQKLSLDTDNNISNEKIDFEQEIRDNDDNNLLEIQNLFPDTDKEELFEELLNEKIDWVNEPIDDDKIYVKNAGLVVLCNFLSFLFKRTKLIERKGRLHQFRSEEAQERAVLLTQFLVTGRENFSEEQLVLNKIICGWPIQKPINTKVVLSEKEKLEANILIKSAIQHWTVLGKISINGLRDSFLVREGVIAFKNSTYNLKVEEKAIDILLSKIPWSFQTLKFPWNKYLILVEWNA